MRYILFLLTGFFMVFCPSVVVAANYGDGVYGACAYGIGCTDNSQDNVGSVVSSAISSAGSAISTFFCTNQSPSSAPILYQINVTDTTATVYFSPAGGPYDRHYIAYGQGNNSEGNGIEIITSRSSGAITYRVSSLSYDNVYTFKVRGGNGCKPGPWSHNVTIQTQLKGNKSIARFYPHKQAKYVTAQKMSVTASMKKYVVSLFPQSPNAGKGHERETTNSNRHQNTSSFWDTIMRFFTGWFHK